VTGQPTEIELGILGPLEVRVAGRPFPVPGARQRALLAALLLRRGHVVPVERLVDEIFGEAPPREARNALQTYVTRLRQALGPAAAIVATRAPGYVLELTGGAVDAERFAALLGQARVTEPPAAALALLDRALGCGGARPTPSSRRPSPEARLCASPSSGWSPRRTGRSCCCGWTGWPRPPPPWRPSSPGNPGGSGRSSCW
jgi:Transcriptional regulatory protein, C terminal